MNRDSLLKARELIAEALEKSDITKFDKMELIINLNKLLNPEEYDSNKAVLNKYTLEKRRKIKGED